MMTFLRPLNQSCILLPWNAYPLYCVRDIHSLQLHWPQLILDNHSSSHAYTKLFSLSLSRTLAVGWKITCPPSQTLRWYNALHPQTHQSMLPILLCISPPWLEVRYTLVAMSSSHSWTAMFACTVDGRRPWLCGNARIQQRISLRMNHNFFTLESWPCRFGAKHDVGMFQRYGDFANRLFVIKQLAHGLYGILTHLAMFFSQCSVIPIFLSIFVNQPKTFPFCHAFPPTDQW